MNKEEIDEEARRKLSRLLRACGLAKNSKTDWTITNSAWKRLEKWEEENGNDV